jgi:hypothetical protein
MAEITSYPLQSHPTGETITIGGRDYALMDRAVDAIYLQEHYSNFLKSGIFPNPSTTAQIFSDGGLTLKINAGGFVYTNGVFHKIENDIKLTLEATEVSDRIDRIVFRSRPSVERDAIIIIKAPEDDLIRNAEIWELALSDVTVRAGSIEILQSDISDLRLDDELCGIVTGLPNSMDATTYFSQLEAKLIELEVKKDDIFNIINGLQSLSFLLVNNNFDDWSIRPGTRISRDFSDPNALQETITFMADDSFLANKLTEFYETDEIPYCKETVTFGPSSIQIGSQTIDTMESTRIKTTNLITLEEVIS